MSLLVINAHTGEHYPPPASAQNTLEAFKAWLSRLSTVAASDQVLLTSSGKVVKEQSLLREVRTMRHTSNPRLTVDKHEIYLYNRQLIAATSTAPRRLSIALLSFPPSRPSPPNTSDPHSDDIQTWRRTFDARRDWAKGLLEDSEAVASEARRQQEATSHIRKALDLAVANLQTHARGLEAKYGQASEWARATKIEHDDTLHSVEIANAQMPHLPANREFLRLLPKLQNATGDPPRSGSLRDFADVTVTDGLVKTVRAASASITKQINAVESGMKGVGQERDRIVNSAEQVGLQSETDASQAADEILDEIQVLVQKLASDSEHVTSLQSSSRSTAQVTKMAQLQTKQYMPTLTEYYEDLIGISGKAKDDHDAAAQESLRTMQAIARTEASLHQLNKQVNSLSISEEAEAASEFLQLLGPLPFVYGALLVEAVRRREWSDRLKAESAELAEDIAGYREEEEKRRKRWMKNIGPLVTSEASTGTVLEFELNLNASQQIWPTATRDNISDYIAALKGLSGVDEIVEELTESAKDLDRPTKRQIKRAKGAFKNGSIHESMHGKGSFLMRENDELRVLREVNVKLEEEVKGQKSRVRRLEDLVYQQQARPSSGNIFAPAEDRRRSSFEPDYEPPSPMTDGSTPRRASVASRGASVSKAAEDKTLALRIVSLEVELEEARSKLQAQQQKHDNEHRTRAEDEDRIRREIAEGNSTKKDLMENMEAQQREFADERRLLQEEAKEHRLKAEEMEEEFDRILGSRDNEKHTSDRKLQEAEMRFAELERESGDAEFEHTTTLQRIRLGLGADTSIAPASTAELLRELEELSARSARKTDDMKQTISSIKADKEALHANSDRQQKEFEAQRDHTRSLEDEMATLRADHEAEKAKATSLSTELNDARAQLRSLRSKFADGETGSEVLRNRLEDQAKRAGNLTTELAETKSHVNSLDFELSSLQRRHQKGLAEAEAATRRLDHRSSRDRELTHALTTVQEALLRLLEDLGLSVYFHEGRLAVQRTSKLNASTSGLADTVQLTVPANTDLKPNDAQLQWMHAASAEEESALFAELIGKLSALDVSTFHEAIIKLRRDIEWTGKKWKHESRVYRDKYQKAHTEGHEKIAFKGFKEGDLALFLPTRNQATRPWAAFNIGAPHYFLREQESHKLQTREWLVARISKVEERIVDLSKSSTGPKARNADAASIKSAGGESAISFDDDNPFELSDGLRWYLIDAVEDKTGITGAPGLGKSTPTTASANVDARGSVRMKRSPKDQTDRDVSKMLNKSLDTDRSRRSSTSSKRASISAIPEETSEVLRALGTTPKTRPGSRSSANTLVTEPLAGLAIDAGRASPSREKVPASQEVSISRANLLFGS